jgi:teichuronic acid biosynthesis glycosyltransferase TuaG
VKPLVSIVIPTYNSGHFLLEAVSSAIEQDYSNTEIIVVDDGSTDNSIELLEVFKGRIDVIQTKNGGAASARNLGILQARGDYIAFLDSDDLWERNKLSVQLEYMDKAQLDLVYCHGQEFGSENGINVLHKAFHYGNCYPYFKKFPTRAIIEMGPTTSVIRKSLLYKSGVFDTSFSGPAEDWDFFRRYCRYAKVGFCDEVLAYHRNHSNNISTRSLNEYYLGNRRALLKMFAEDPNIHAVERRNIWVKFHFMSAKSFLKIGKVIHFFRSTARIFLPITL